MKTKEIIETISNLEPRSMRSYYDIVWKKTNNDILYDTDGKKYIDFTSTIFVQNVGHSNPKVINAIKKAATKQLTHTYTYYHEGRAKILQKLINMSQPYGEKAFLLSSGTEATEAAVKMARWYGGVNKPIVLSFIGAMHGRTMAAELMKGTNTYPRHKHFWHLPFPNDQNNFESDLKDIGVNTKKICGIIIESYQGWSARLLPKQYVQDLCNWAKENDVLVCFDEIQAGLGRTGKLFTFQHYDVDPDLFCLGKGLGGGLPLSAVIGKSKILNIPDIGDMSSTHSANPICCASGLAVLNELDRIIKSNKFRQNINCFETYIENIKCRHNFSSILLEVNYCGMVAGFVFKNKTIADNVCDICVKKGLLPVHTGRESVKIGPPLTITQDHLTKGLMIFDNAIADVWRNNI
ncbi:MAG: aminotransferase class III-fold pyridoxal phosphate-dependent enzyme [Candidatus Nanoarchaeia archaeon]|jgi:acetylornithine/succinyldiaminopimelate/putrescine aminotransferase|nr:aminotransferase class III-fold pyridoxal phosphate-dependent enzyme [Candidatus Nanoarchaeia archaeon]